MKGRNNVAYMKDFRQEWLAIWCQCSRCGYKWVIVGHITTYKKYNECRICECRIDLKYGKEVKL